MRVRSKHFYSSLAIACAGLLVYVAAVNWSGQLGSAARVEVSDLLLVRANGPRLGARPARADIVLVLFDKASADELGYVHEYANDLALYRKLIEAGAQVVFDTRMLAMATPEAFDEARPLLDGMLAIDDGGKLTRDIWLSSSLYEQHGSNFSVLMVQNIINSHPHAYPSVGSRLYPLCYFDSRGVNESAPLIICRHVWNAARGSNDEVGAELRRSGIMSQWHRFAPTLVPQTHVAPSDYQIGTHRIHWHPFLSTSMLVPPAAFWVRYDTPELGFQRFAYADILRQSLPPTLANKIVLIGYSADVDPTSDTYTVPNTLGKAAAAEVVASAIQTLLDGCQTRAIPPWFQYCIAVFLIGGVCFVAGMARPLQSIMGVIALLACYYLLAIVSYRYDWFADFLVAPSVAMMTAIPAGGANAWFSLRARQRVVDLFGRYVPRAIVNQLIQQSERESLTLGGLEREVTVMFADIRGFTHFSEDLPPEEVVRQLNSLLEVMVACTFENEGTLDKFIGDAILVLFNVPLSQPDHAQRAVRTAKDIQHRLASHTSGLRVGIGIHCGSAVVGNIGTPQRMEYTAIGSTVNIASRLCDLAEPGEIIVSQAVAEQLDNAFVGDAFELDSANTVNVKGIKASLQIARLKSL